MNADHPLKGKRGGHCNRATCQQAGAWWWSPTVGRYFCERCARELNRLTPNLPPCYPVAQ